MPDSVATTPTTTAGTPAEIEIPQPAESIAEHAQQFGPDAGRDEELEQPERKAHPSEQQKRDRNNGQWSEGKRRGNPEKRINELTERRKSAEERATALEAEVARLKTQHAPPQQVRQAEQRIETAQNPQRQVVRGDAEPKETDPKYNGNYLAYLDDRTRWVARQEWGQQQTKAREQASAHQATQAWGTKVDKAREKYQDFDQVAFAATNIPPDSVVDKWIDQHRAGTDVLYYLQSHPQERDSLLRKSAFEQVEDLALLSARLLSNTNGLSGGTGSLGGREKVIVLPPKPPNPVRTEAQRAEHVPPPTDGSLSIAEHSKNFGPARR